MKIGIIRFRFLLISLMFSAKKGLSALQAARDLEMRSATVWSMMHRIRKATLENPEAVGALYCRPERQQFIFRTVAEFIQDQDLEDGK